MTKLVHISDLHFGRADPPVIEALRTSLQRLHPDLVIISGDLTQRAKTRQFMAARRFLDKLALPCLVVPGNHDISAFNLAERFLYPWKKWQRIVHHSLADTVHLDSCSVAGINTVRRWGSLFDWTRGRINREQLDSIRKEFQALPESQLRILVAHHPFWLPEAQKHRKLIGRRDKALPLFEKWGIDIILSGHVHLPYTQVMEGVIISHAGTVISTRLVSDQPNSFSLIQGDREHLDILTMNWNGTGFQRQRKDSFVRSASNWRRAFSPPIRTDSLSDDSD